MNGTKIQNPKKKVVTWKGVFIFAFDNCAIIGPIVENFHLLLIKKLTTLLSR